jgi:hypothetical protein
MAPLHAVIAYEAVPVPDWVMPWYPEEYKANCGFYPRGMATLRDAQTSEEAVQALVKAGADVDARDTWGMTALHRAAHYGAAGAVRALLAAGANVGAGGSFRGPTPLHLAAQSGRQEAIGTMEALLAGGADVNAPDTGGRTPLGSLGLYEFGVEGPEYDAIKDFLKAKGGR